MDPANWIFLINLYLPNLRKTETKQSVLEQCRKCGLGLPVLQNRILAPDLLTKSGLSMLCWGNYKQRSPVLSPGLPDPAPSKLCSLISGFVIMFTYITIDMHMYRHVPNSEVRMFTTRPCFQTIFQWRLPSITRVEIWTGEMFPVW